MASQPRQSKIQHITVVRIAVPYATLARFGQQRVGGFGAADKDAAVGRSGGFQLAEPVQQRD